MSGKGFAIASLGLGIVGLFTAGGLVVGSLLGLVLAAAALVRGAERSGRDVAWAAIAANLFALTTVLPLAGAAWALRDTPMPLFESDRDALPEPAQPPFAADGAFVEPPPPPPPPPPPAEVSHVSRPQPSREPTVRPRSRPSRESVAPASEAPADVAAVRVGGSIREPRKTRNVPPVYPQDALQARVQGVVILECTIDERGRVSDVRVKRGVPLLNDAAVAAVRQWEYEPTELNGVPVPVVMTVTVNFKLS